MAYENVTLSKSFPVAANLSAFQYCLVTLTTAGLLTTAADTATVILGVLQNKPDNSVETLGEVAIAGIAQVKANGTTDIAYGASLTATTGGVAITTTTDNAQIVGVALEDHTANADAVITVLLTPARRY